MSEAEPNKLGRPEACTPEIIIYRVMEGESLRSISFDPDMPSRSTIHKALSEDDAFSDKYARACEIRADLIFDEMFEIADDGSNDWMEITVGEHTKEVVNHEHVSRSKLRIDTRKWALARMSPRKYGEKLDLNHGGQGVKNPIRAITQNMSAKEAAEAYASSLDDE